MSVENTVPYSFSCRPPNNSSNKVDGIKALISSSHKIVRWTFFVWLTMYFGPLRWARRWSKGNKITRDMSRGWLVWGPLCHYMWNMQDKILPEIILNGEKGFNVSSLDRWDLDSWRSTKQHIGHVSGQYYLLDFSKIWLPLMLSMLSDLMKHTKVHVWLKSPGVKSGECSEILF